MSCCIKCSSHLHIVEVLWLVPGQMLSRVLVTTRFLPRAWGDFIFIGNIENVTQLCWNVPTECSVLKLKQFNSCQTAAGWNDSHLNCKAANINCSLGTYLVNTRSQISTETNYRSSWQCIYDDSIHLVIMGGILFIAIMFLFRAKYFLFFNRKNIWDPSLSMWRLCWQ